MLVFSPLTKAALGGLLVSGLLALAVQVQAQPQLVDLAQFRWQKRLLFLFAPAADDRALQTMQTALAQARTEVQDRDLVVFVILEQGQSQQNGQPLTPQASQALRQRFGITPQTTTVVLVGKDGGVKLQRPGPVPLTDIFALIDSMPMRQQERRFR
jgi:hypothetical protein